MVPTLRSILLGMLLVTGAARAQIADEVIADRPHFTDAPALVPTGMAQIEAGVRYEGDYAVYTSRLPTLLLRVGLMESTELRLGGDFVHREREVNREPRTAKDNGAGDLTVGAKFLLSDGSGDIPPGALVATLALPFGARAFRPEHLAPDIRLATSYTFNEVFDLAGNIGGEWDGISGAGAGLYALRLGVTLGDGWKGYLEAFGRFPAGAPESHFIDGTMRLLVAPDCELNLTAGYPFTPVGLDHFFELGMALRLR